MQNTDSNKKSFLDKTFEAVGDAVGFASDIATLPIEALSNPDALMKENCTIVSAKDYYHNKNLSDNQIVLVQKNKFLGITYKSLKVAEGSVSNKGREGVWFDYEYSGGKTYRTERTEYKNGKKHGSYHEEKVMDNDVYVKALKTIPFMNALFIKMMSRLKFINMMITVNLLMFIPILLPIIIYHRKHRLHHRIMQIL